MRNSLFFIGVTLLLLSCHAFGQDLKLSITGLNAKETKTIDSIGYLKTHNDYRSITTTTDSLQRQLHRFGYIESKLLGIEKRTDSTFTAQIHLKTKFNTITIYYNDTRIDKALISAVSDQITDTYFTIPLSTLEYALNFLNSEFANKGRPFSKLKLTDVKKNSATTLTGHLTLIAKEKQRIINAITVKGYEKFPKSYLKHYLKLKPKQPFNLAVIKNKTAQLANLRFANQIKPAEVLFKKDSTTLYLYIGKSKSNTFDGFLGFGTNEDTNSIEFDGFLNLKLTNNLNFGESFSLLYKSDENDQETFDISVDLPYLFNTPIGLDLNLRLFRRDSSFSTVDQKAKINYQINALHKVSTGISTIVSTNLQSENILSTLEDYTSNYFTLGYEFLKPSYYDQLFPVKSNFYIESNFGNRKTTNTKVQQTLLRLKAFHNFSFGKKNGLYLNADAGQLISDTFFENELLRFGGINSIRGFEENSLFASLFGVFNTEYRFRVSNSIYIHSITDVAYFENQISDTKEKLFGYGFGFGILTKSGLLKFNYANGKNENQRFQLSNSKIHVSLIANF